MHAHMHEHTHTYMYMYTHTPLCTWRVTGPCDMDYIIGLACKA